MEIFQNSILLRNLQRQQWYISVIKKRNLLHNKTNLAQLNYLFFPSSTMIYHLEFPPVFCVFTFLVLHAIVKLMIHKNSPKNGTDLALKQLMY